MNLTSIERTAFALGYLDGKKCKTHFSRRQAGRKLAGLPGSAIDAYLSGRDDGVRGDDWRYRLICSLTKSDAGHPDNVIL